MIHQHRQEMKGLARLKRCETKAMSFIEPYLGDQRIYFPVFSDHFTSQSLMSRFSTYVVCMLFGIIAIVKMSFVIAVCLIHIFQVFSFIVH